MKMTQEHYRELKQAIYNTLVICSQVSLTKYKLLGLSQERFRWDLFHFSNFPSKRSLYKYLNDDHIDTALRKITGTT